MLSHARARSRSSVCETSISGCIYGDALSIELTARGSAGTLGISTV